MKKFAFLLLLLLIFPLIASSQQWIKMQLLGNPLGIAKQGDTTVCYTHIGSMYGLYRSINRGDSWEKIYDYIRTQEEPFSIVIRDSIYLMNEAQGLHRSTDYGASWEYLNPKIYPPPDMSSWLRLLMTNQFLYVNGILYASTFMGIYQSLDFGQSWETKGVGKFPNITFRSISGLLIQNGYLFASSKGYPILRMRMDSDTLEPVMGGYKTDIDEFEYVTYNVGKNLTGINGLLYIRLAPNKSAPDRVFYTEDNGESWLELDIPDSLKMGYIQMKSCGDNLFLLSGSAIIIYNTVSRSWKSLSLYRDNIHFSPYWLEIYDDYFFFSTDKGLFRAPNVNCDIAEIPFGLVMPDAVEEQKYSFQPLHPNPASGSVSISLEGGLRLVSVYNLLGAEALSKEFSGEKGISSLDVSGLSPGVYFVKYRYSIGAERVEKLIIGN